MIRSLQRFLIPPVFLVSTLLTLGQGVTIHGKVTDVTTSEQLVGVNIVVDSTTGISTDTEGKYEMKLGPGWHQLNFSYIGYISVIRTVQLPANENLTLNIQLEPLIIELGEAVVSAGRFKQKLSDVTVSMQVIKPDYIQQTNTINMESVISQMPGVDVMDGQANIRGGSGYSYGAGSRVMVLVDDLPMLTADVNEVKWNFLPVENIGNVEIVKGASSSLYGSSALNGVINLRLAQPGNVPSTRMSVYSGMYCKPSNESMAWWWDSNPVFTGASIVHLRKIGSFDLVAGAYALGDQGYREEDYEERFRFNVGLRHHPVRIEGLSYGVNANMQEQRTCDFLIWMDADSGAFLQQQEAVSPTKGFRINVDPYANYYDAKGGRHSLRTRYYKTYNRFDEEDQSKNNGSEMYYGEYQYHREFVRKWYWTAGMAGSYAKTDAELFGDHYSSNIALFTQLDKKFMERLSASLGIRWERYTLDRTDDESEPVIRAGLNYQAGAFTYLRASFGQGYRYPSIAEKYTSATLGSLNIFPNPDLQPETGWSTELGLRQGWKLGRWMGYADIAAFWMEYQDMMEFTFGVYLPDSVTMPTLDDLGFKSLNIGHARIAGVDLMVGGSGKFLKQPVRFFAGYTYMDPVDLSADTLENNILKYRFHHEVKGDVQWDYKGFSVGISLVYNSNIERIDEAFEEKILGHEIFKGLKRYRQENDKGFLIFDARFAYQITTHIRMALHVKNLFNKEYMGRPGDIQPPRNICLEASVSL
ncbi:MAG: TonB-dependent receptor [Bacteroidales bacterium]|nr:TonB-dependent receptor [Lentimicrobiaceae bacterium]MDD5695569.1 TonB-dependent receptor [Bacteroidales bacterium]